MGKRARRRENRKKKAVFGAREIQARAAEASRLVRSHLEGCEGATVRDWPLLGPALVMRIVDCSESAAILVREGRPDDASILVRTVYECAVTFAWIAADPQTRVSEYLARCGCEERELLRGLSEYGVDAPDDFEESLQVLIGMAETPMPRKVLARARDADRFWKERLPYLANTSPLTDFASLYASFYRRVSKNAHGHVDSLRRHLDQKKDRTRVVPESKMPETSANFWVGIVSHIVLLTLLICNEQFDWPLAEEIQSLSSVGIPSDL